MGSTKQLIVTWPTWVHESLDVLLVAFQQIALVPDLPVQYRCLYNKDIRVGSKDDRIPDFQFSRTAANGDSEHVIIVECAVSQTARSVWPKAEMWAQTKHVELVVGIDVLQTPYASPEDDTKVNGPMGSDGEHITVEKITAMQLPPYGPIEFNGHQWAGEIRAITVRLYFPPTETQPKITFEEFVSFCL
jgi:hypothetical protein